MQELIINSNGENKRIALVENGKLIERYEERPDMHRLEGNIYIGKVENVLQGMQAAFVNIGEEKNTFMHIKDVIPKVSNETGNKNELLSKYDIKDYIKVGMPILVQVKKDSTNKKGARVSTNISLPGRFVVLLPDTNFITISKKITDTNKRKELQKLVQSELPKNYGAIVRTSAENKDAELIQRDVKSLVKLWELIKENAKNIEQEKKFEPTLIYENEGIIGKLLTDLIDQDLERIITNDKNIYSKISNILEQTGASNIKLEIREKDSVLDLYDLENQIEKAKSRKIWLKCGGFITIDKTEALTAVDVNSGKYIGGKDLEQTVYRVNKEATLEIAKQLRLRDIGGIIIIDYIDMEKEETKKKILEELNECLKKDRSKTQVIGFTPLDLLEMTRKHMCSND
jgi:ribonuclease G